MHELIFFVVVSFWFGGFLANLMIQQYIGNKLPWDLRVVLAMVWPTILFIKDSKEDKIEE